VINKIAIRKDAAGKYYKRENVEFESYESYESYETSEYSE